MIKGTGFHRQYHVSVNYPGEILKLNKDSGIDVLILLEIRRNQYYFDYYELLHRGVFPETASEVIILSKNNSISYEAIGQVLLSSLVYPSSKDSKDSVVELLRDDHREVLGLEITGITVDPLTRSTNSGFELQLPIHFNYLVASLPHHNSINTTNTNTNNTTTNTVVRVASPLYFWKHHGDIDQSTSSQQEGSLSNRLPHGPKVIRRYQTSYLGESNDAVRDYLRDLCRQIENNNYHSFSSIAIDSKELEVVIPVGQTRDYPIVTGVTLLVVIALLVSLLLHLLVFIKEVLSSPPEPSLYSMRRSLSKKKD